MFAIGVGSLAACAEKDGGDTGEGENAPIAVTSSNDDCELGSSEAQTSPVRFTVESAGDRVTEFYVFGEDSRVLGEVENIGPGLKGTLIVDIASPGGYRVACKPGTVGRGISGEIAVSGEEKETLQGSTEVEDAKSEYLDYVPGQTDVLVDQTSALVDARPRSRICRYSPGTTSIRRAPTATS
ncbi:hypothetical protein [Dietzia timorensis]|uniref:EfeO-type cupredoxin-like domain-containing protein n=1 Tax=Dietzia timorensis TaxID=499555 RepID=A0A173LQM9_9ACTN|nr:hypothetical protein [Dietzia timorensis]ANI94074.1 Hypothetical protein BJL86_3315 [Dietzia timorensis]